MQGRLLKVSTLPSCLQLWRALLKSHVLTPQEAQWMQVLHGVDQPDLLGPRGQRQPPGGSDI
jgi:hypothetical protein